MRVLFGNPLGQLFLATLVSLIFWHAAHHLRHFALDLGLHKVQIPLSYGLYGLALLGTTCCALPIALVALGAGGAVASMASTLPWLVALSEYKVATFGITAAALVYSWWQMERVGRAGMCDIAHSKRLRLQRWVLRTATAVFAVSVFAAYAALPLVMWLEG